MPAVRCGIQDHIIGAPLDPAIQHGFERFILGVVMRKRQVVAIQDEPARRVTQQRQTAAQAGQIFALHFDDFQIRVSRIKIAMHSLDKAGFPHPPCAPEQGVVGGQPPGKLFCIDPQCIAGPVDPDQQRQINPVDPRHWLQPVRIDMPDIGRGGKVRRGKRGRGHPLQSVSDTKQGRAGQVRRAHALVSASSSGISTQVPSARIRASVCFSARRTRKIDTSYSG